MIPDRLSINECVVVYANGEPEVRRLPYGNDELHHRRWVITKMPGDRDAVELFKASQVKPFLGKASFPLKAHKSFPNLDAALAWVALTGEVP